MKSVAQQWFFRGLIVFAGAVFLAIFLRTSIARGFSERFFGWINRPFTVVGENLNAEGELIFSSRDELIDELILSEDKVKDLAQVASRLELAAQERDDALSLLEYRPSSNLDVVTAKVFMRSRHLDEEEIVIDQGALDGIQKGEAVVARNGLFVGVVSDVAPHSSRVVLLTDEESVVGASLMGRQGTLGVAAGGFGSLVHFDFVPRTVGVEVNDIVVTSGIDPLIPAGLVIGLVNAIEENPDAPFFQLFVEPLANLSQLRIVGVLHHEFI